MKQKILLVCGQEMIKERNDGGKLCSYRNWELFSEVFGKENAYLIMFSKYTDVDEKKHILRLPAHQNSMCKAVHILKGNMFTSASNEKKVIDFIRENQIDIVVFERSMFGSLIKQIKRETDCKVWIFMDNIERQYFKNKLTHRGPLYLLPYLCVGHSERQSLKYADYIMTLTMRDSRLLKEIYGVEGDIVLPMTFRDRYEEERQIVRTDKKELLFIGTMFPPNYDGVKWFVEQVMPELPDYTLRIVGKNFERKREGLQRTNVEVVGTVDDLSKYYYSDSAMIMPIFYGDGMKVKTAESMMYGRVIFAADEALEGYETEGVRGIYRCNSKEEYIASIREFFDKREQVCFQPEVRRLFLEKYSFENQVRYCKEEWG